MSNELFPAMPFLAFDKKCNSQFATVIHAPANGQEVRGSFSGYPLWLFSLNFSLMDNSGDYTDLETLHGFILQRRGSFDSFLYSHPNANSVDRQFLGTGDGIRADWQLKRVWGGFTEPVENPDTVEVLVNSAVVDPTYYTLSATGLVSFKTSPVDHRPAAGAVVSWSGGYYYRCRFEADVTDFTEFSHQLYNHADFAFRGSPVNKV